MKKTLFFGLLILIMSVLLLPAKAKDVVTADIAGRWAEKISERVVMDIFPDNTAGKYKIFITWREDNLAQKDIYRFTATDRGDGILEYKNGTHIYRTFASKDKFEDKVDYTDGSGSFVPSNNGLTWIDNKDKSENTQFIRADKNLTNDTTVKNKLFSVRLPEELKGIYQAKTDKNTIYFYHKESKKAGFGGFAFAIRAYKNPSEHAVLPGSRKIGELTDKKGILYDMVLKHPTDVQYDYTKSPKAPETFKLLYEYGEIADVKGGKGVTFHKNQGMKGADLYKNILKKYVNILKEKHDSDWYEKHEMSYMYNVISQGLKKDENLLDKIGYAFYDVNADGIEELFIGEIAQGDWKGVVYDIYTMVNRHPKHVVSGGERDRYFVCDDAFLCNEYSQGAGESGIRVYNLVENSTELFPQVAFKYDSYTNPKQPWFISYGSDINDDKWENMEQKEILKRKSVFDRYIRFDYIPLSTVGITSHKFPHPDRGG